MQAKDIEVGVDYAYVESMSDGAPHLLNAEVLAPPRSGSVRVRIEHPDDHVEDWETDVPTKNLLGLWNSTPEFNDPGYRKAEPTSEFGLRNREVQSYAETAHRRHARIVEQRELVRRLKAVGLERVEPHYARKGGTELSLDERFARRDAGLPPVRRNVTQFSRDEVIKLLEMIEGGIGPTLAYIVSDVETREQIDPPTVIGARAEFYDLHHHDRAHEDAAEHPASLLFLGWDKTRPVKVYRVVPD